MRAKADNGKGGFENRYFSRRPLFTTSSWMGMRENAVPAHASTGNALHTIFNTSI